MRSWSQTWVAGPRPSWREVGRRRDGRVGPRCHRGRQAYERSSRAADGPGRLLLPIICTTTLGGYGCHPLLQGAPWACRGRTAGPRPHSRQDGAAGPTGSRPAPGSRTYPAHTALASRSDVEGGAVTGVKPSGFGFPNTWEETRPGSFPRAGPQPLFQHILSKDELRAGEHFSQTLNSKSQLGMSYKYSENRGRYKARFTTQQDEKVFQRKGHEMRAPDRFLGDRDSAGTARPPTRPRAALWALQEGAGLFRGLPFQGNAE